MLLSTKQKLGKKAYLSALEIRANNNLEIWEPICVYDLVEKIGVELIFTQIPSLEGLFIRKSKPIILISSLRPSGRQTYTCAHELGHHIYNHGAKIDEEGYLDSTNYVEEEYLANIFAGFLLMPQIAVEHAFRIRNLNISNASPVDYYKISKNFGVGYSTLINHMQWTLKLIEKNKAQKLLKLNPKKIKQLILDVEFNSELFVVDQFWNGRPIDIFIDDIILISNEAIFDGSCVEKIKSYHEYEIYQAISPGIGRFVINDWSSYVRVSRKEYEGRNIFRHLEE